MAAARQYEIKVSITEVATTMRTRLEAEFPGCRGEDILKEVASQCCGVFSNPNKFNGVKR
jgi:hypothetical protein